MTSVSCWIGFAWGVLYCIIESVAPAFRSVHHFGTGEVGTVFAALVYVSASCAANSTIANDTYLGLVLSLVSHPTCTKSASTASISPSMARKRVYTGPWEVAYFSP